MSRGIARNYRDDMRDRRMTLRSKSEELAGLGLTNTLYSVYKGANEGDPKSMLHLAQAYYNGRGAVKDVKRAFIWYKKAAEYDQIPAQCTLGCMYYTGEGGEQSDELAFYWLNKAAYHNYPRAMTSLATLYYEGRGCEKNEREEFRLLRESMKLGYAPAAERFKKRFVKEREDELAILAQMPDPETEIPAEDDTVEDASDEAVSETVTEPVKKIVFRPPWETDEETAVEGSDIDESTIEESDVSEEPAPSDNTLRYDYTAMLVRTRERRRRKFRSAEYEGQTRIDDF